MPINTLEKLDKNKSDFIQVAAHELRTPLTVIKGYMGMIKSAPAMQNNPTYTGNGRCNAGHGSPASDRQQHVGCGAAREPGTCTHILKHVTLGPILRLIQKDYASDLACVRSTLEDRSGYQFCACRFRQTLNSCKKRLTT